LIALNIKGKKLTTVLGKVIEAAQILVVSLRRPLSPRGERGKDTPKEKDRKPLWFYPDTGTLYHPFKI